MGLIYTLEVSFPTERNRGKMQLKFTNRLEVEKFIKDAKKYKIRAEELTGELPHSSDSAIDHVMAYRRRLNETFRKTKNLEQLRLTP